MKTIMTAIAALTLTATAYAAPKRAAPKVTREQATKTALERVPDGKIESVELEDEGGKRVWSFDLRVGKDVREIQVDSVSGAIVDDKVETPKQQSEEKAADEAKAKKAKKDKKPKKKL